jgi:hypothetical protein
LRAYLLEKADILATIADGITSSASSRNAELTAMQSCLIEVPLL